MQNLTELNRPDSSEFITSLPELPEDFYPAKMKFVKRNGEYVGYQLISCAKRDWVTKIVLCPDLFKEDYYRKLTCAHCKRTARPRYFHWKVKGAEGPFPELWGKRDSLCMQCRSIQKAEFYLRKKKENTRRKKSKTVIDLSACEVIEEFPPGFFGISQATLAQFISKLME